MPSFYDPIAAQAAFNPFAGGYAPLAPYGGYGGGYGGWPGGGWGYDIVGQAPTTTTPPATTAPATTDAGTSESLTDKGKRFLKKETFGVKNQNWLLGAAAIGVIYYGYQAEWFGKHAKSSSGDPRRRRHHGRRRDESMSDMRDHRRGRHHGRHHRYY